MTLRIITCLLFAALVMPFLGAFEDVRQNRSDLNRSSNENKSYGEPDEAITLENKGSEACSRMYRDLHLRSTQKGVNAATKNRARRNLGKEEENSTGQNRQLKVELNDQLHSEGEHDDFEEDPEGDGEDEGLLSSYSRWDVFDHEDDENLFIDEDQVDPPDMIYSAEEEATRVTQMEMDFFDYIEGLEEYDTDDDDEEGTSIASENLGEEHVFENYFVQTTLPSPSSVSDECDGDIPKNKRKKKSKKKKTPQFEIMTMGKMGKGKLMSRWQKNCCIRGRRVGNSRRTFLSDNLFKECKERTRKVRSRMSKSCKWIFWSCCEAKALRRFYFFAKTRKDDWCS